MITKTASLTGAGSGTVNSTLLIGPVDAPYDALVTIGAGNVGLAGAAFSLTSDATNGGAWYAPAFASTQTVSVHLTTGDSLYGAIYSGSAYVAILASVSGEG